MATTASTTLPESTTPQSTTPQPTVSPTDTPTPDSTQPVNTGVFTYKSGNTNVATVSSDGIITAKGNGTTTITVTHDSLGPKTVNVEVKTKVKSLSVNVTDNGKTTNYKGVATPDLTNKILSKSGLTEKTIILTPVYESGNSHSVSDEYKTISWIQTGGLLNNDKVSCEVKSGTRIMHLTLLPGASFTGTIGLKHYSDDCGEINCTWYLTVTPEYTSFSVSPESVVLFTNGDNTEQITTTFN